jgi:hypothetical protein
MPKAICIYPASESSCWPNSRTLLASLYSQHPNSPAELMAVHQRYAACAFMSASPHQRNREVQPVVLDVGANRRM